MERKQPNHTKKNNPSDTEPRPPQLNQPPPIEQVALSPHTQEKICQILEQHYPNAQTELHYSSHFELLLAVILSAQATDVSVNACTQHLFPIANTPEAILALGEAGLKAQIKRIGLYNSKAKHILQTCQILIQQHNSQIPHTRAALEALPGVGRKTANVLLNIIWKQDTIAVDTHVFRVSNRTGLAPGKTPLAVERQLMQAIPKPYRRHAHHWLVLHGRYTCLARRPKCPECPILRYCEYEHKTI